MSFSKEWKNLTCGKLKLKIHREVYEPAEDTYLLLDNIELKKGELVLDLGTGCGILAIHAADMGCTVIAVDINPYAVKNALINVRENRLKNKIHIIRGDLFGPFRPYRLFDTILFNPPYLPIQSQEGEWLERAWSGGSSGREIIDSFIDEAPKYLKRTGKIFIVQSSLSNIDETINRLRSLKFKVEVKAERVFHFERLVFISASKLNG